MRHVRGQGVRDTYLCRLATATDLSRPFAPPATAPTAPFPCMHLTHQHRGRLLGTTPTLFAPAGTRNLPLDLSRRGRLLAGPKLRGLLGDAFAEARVRVHVELGGLNLKVKPAGLEAAVDALKLVLVDGVEAQLVKVVKQPGPVAEDAVDAELVPPGECAPKVDVAAWGVLDFASGRTSTLGVS